MTKAPNGPLVTLQMAIVHGGQSLTGHTAELH